MEPVCKYISLSKENTYHCLILLCYLLGIGDTSNFVCAHLCRHGCLYSSVCSASKGCSLCTSMLDAYTVKDKPKQNKQHTFSIDIYFSAETSSANAVLCSIWATKEWEGRKKKENIKTP